MGAKIAKREATLQKVVDWLEADKDRKYILAQLESEMGVRTVDKLIAQAKAKIKAYNDEKEQIRKDKFTEDYGQQLDKAIKSDIELEAILCQIATAGLKVEEIVKGTPIIRNVLPSEQIAAIDKLFKKRGVYVTKVAQTNKDGTDITPITDGQFEKILDAIKAGKV